LLSPTTPLTNVTISICSDALNFDIKPTKYHWMDFVHYALPAGRKISGEEEEEDANE
jgi:hypothetical protein